MSRPASFALILVLVVPVAAAQTSSPRAASKRRATPPASQAVEPPAALEQPSASWARRRAAAAAAVAPAETAGTAARPGAIAIDPETDIVTTRIWRSARRIGVPTIGPRYPVGPASPIR